jgi:hypothetical protein
MRAVFDDFALREIIEIALEYGSTPREFAARVSPAEYQVIRAHRRLKVHELSGRDPEELAPIVVDPGAEIPGLKFG